MAKTPEVMMRERIIEVAEAERGYRETGNNVNKYSRELGRGPEPWCGDFTEWAVWKASGIRLGVLTNIEYTPATVAFGRRRGLLRAVAMTADLAFWDWQLDSVPDHTGFASRDGRGVPTWEGNTRPGPGGDQSGMGGNGDGMFLRDRGSANLVGYVDIIALLKLAGWKPGSMVPPVAQGTPYKASGLAVDGDWGELTTIQLQLLLNKLDAGKYDDLLVDGDYGPKTETKLRWLMGAKRYETTAVAFARFAKKTIAPSKAAFTRAVQDWINKSNGVK